MAEKLKSILKRTHWSSVLKAAIFGAAWFFLPYWIFLVVALVLYFLPISGSAKVAVPFFVLLALGLFEPQGIFFALVFAGLFYAIILVKDLLIIDRDSAYEILVLVLTFLLFREFFIKMGGAFGGWSLIVAAIAAAGESALIGSLMGNSVNAPAGAHQFRRMMSWLLFVLIWQVLLVALFLPLDFVYQLIITFLISIFFIEIFPPYFFGRLTRTRMLATTSVVLAMLTIVLSSARWGL